MNFDEFSTPKNRLKEGKMAELDLDLKDKKLTDAEFKSKYKNSRAEMKAKTTSKPAKKKVKEATGDPAFDGMMGKIAGSTTPQTAGGAASDKVGSAANQPPDAETIEALNKMMYDMHVTMLTANRLMQKLMQGR